MLGVFVLIDNFLRSACTYFLFHLNYLSISEDAIRWKYFCSIENNFAKTESIIIISQVFWFLHLQQHHNYIGLTTSNSLHVISHGFNKLFHGVYCSHFVLVVPLSSHFPICFSMGLSPLRVSGWCFLLYSILFWKVAWIAPGIQEHICWCVSRWAVAARWWYASFLSSLERPVHLSSIWCIVNGSFWQILLLTVREISNVKLDQGFFVAKKTCYSWIELCLNNNLSVGMDIMLLCQVMQKHCQNSLPGLILQFGLFVL